MTTLARSLGPLALITLLATCVSDSAPAVLGVDGAWSRPTPAGASNGVVYLSVMTDADDALIAAETPPSIARAAELHSSMIPDAQGGGHHGGGDAVTDDTAAKVDGFPITVGTPLVFRPGGNHVMLVDLAGPLAAGDRFPLTLHFESGRQLVADVVVADNPPG